jgi:hypothetical protein
MDFREAESKYYELKGQLEAGALTPGQFAEEVAKLRSQDDQGQWWTVDGATGGWLRYDGSRWVPARATGTIPPGPRPPAARGARRTGGRRAALLIGAVAVAAVLCLVAVGGAALVVTRSGGVTGSVQEPATVSQGEAERIADDIISEQFPDIKDGQKLIGSYENSAGTKFWTITYRKDDQAESEGQTYDIPRVVIVSVDQDTGEAIAAVSS